MALGMFYHGAEGNTRHETNILLGYSSLDETEVLNYQKSQLKYLQGLDDEAVLVMGNALFMTPIEP